MFITSEIRKHDILFIGETWQHKDNLNNLHQPLGYFHDFVHRENFDKKSALPGLYLFINVVSCKEKFKSMICHQKTIFGLR